MNSKRDKNKPKTVGQYYLMEKIAQGGMAEIFKGLSYDVHGIKKTVCIKKILAHIAASEEFIDSLIDEAKIAVKLVHGNIAQTYDLGKVGEDYFMVMEFVDGKSLSQINKRCLAKGDMIPIEHLVHFIAEVLNGLDYIHRRTDEKGIPLHIVHRDMSPQNIMVSYSGTVKIIDFGIAKSGFKVGATDAGILKGKFAYMSPEQAYGDTIDHRSDIFSAGIMLHEMLVGKRLFKASDSRETIRNVRKAKISPPSSLRPEIPDELDRIVMKSLAKDRRYRYAQASEMRDDLIKFLHANYPEFRVSDMEEFVQGLFKDDLESSKRQDDDAKTPYLIIDGTNSALADDSQFEITGAMKAPVDLKEYMIEETGEGPGEEDYEEDEPEHENIHEEATTPKPLSPRINKLKKIQLISASIAIVFLLIAAAVHIFKQESEDTAVASGEFAEAMIVTDPIDSEVYLDDTLQGKGSPVTIKNVTSGEDHILRVQKDGFLPHERNLRLSPMQFVSISVALTPSAPATSSIEIITMPSGATIFVDDRETFKKTPAKIENLDPRKKHPIGLYLKGHKFWSKEVSLEPGQLRTFDVQLQKDVASLVIHSTPTGALILMDGSPAGQTPLTINNLEPDKIYTVEVWLKGFDTAKREFRATAGKKEDMRFILEQVPTPAEIESKSRGKKNGQ